MKYAGKPLCNLIVVDTLATSLIVYARPCMGFLFFFSVLCLRKRWFYESQNQQQSILFFLPRKIMKKNYFSLNLER